MADGDDAVALDHVGWLLWRASRRWVARYVEEVRNAGFTEFTLSRANLLAHLDPREGTPQSTLVERTGLSKQAANQLIDELQSAGLVERVADHSDRRARRVRYTARGIAMLRAGDTVKRRLESELATRMGLDEFLSFKDLLRRIC